MQECEKASSAPRSFCRSRGRKGTWQSQLSKKNGVRKGDRYQSQVVAEDPGSLFTENSAEPLLIPPRVKSGTSCQRRKK